MRGDRLLSVLMLLQSRRRMSASALGRELEVSTRTIYRDIEALSTAGVPIYAEPGRQGGFALLDSYRTDLTGLTEGEVRALFMLSIPAPLVRLGISQELKSALLKLSAALPDSRRATEERVRQRMHLDSTWWQQQGEEVPHLHILYQAVWQDRRVELRYPVLPGLEIEQTVDPYGLVAKAGVWYLVCKHNEQVHVHRVAHLLAAHLAEEHFTRRAGFDLPAFWALWCAEQEGRQARCAVVARFAPGFLPNLTHYLGEEARQDLTRPNPPDADGWVRLELSFESIEEARRKLLPLGGGVEVLSPRPLRASMADFGEQIASMYRCHLPASFHDSSR